MYIESSDNYSKTNIIDKKTNNAYQVYSHNNKKLINTNNEFKYDSENEDFLAVNANAYSLLIIFAISFWVILLLLVINSIILFCISFAT